VCLSIETLKVKKIETLLSMKLSRDNKKSSEMVKIFLPFLFLSKVLIAMEKYCSNSVEELLRAVTP
jgi:hypothetical protein